MDKVVAFATVFAGIFIAVFVLTFLWGVGKRILRWTVIAAVAYAGIVIAVHVAHFGGDGAPITMENLLSVTVSSYSSLVSRFRSSQAFAARSERTSESKGH